MTWWAHISNPRPFNVFVSIGLPGNVHEAEPDDETVTQERDTLRYARWRQTVTAALRATLARGGTVVSGFDPDLFPLVSAVALQHAAPLPAEHGELRHGTPIDLIIGPSTLDGYRPLDPFTDEPQDVDRLLLGWEGLGALTFVEMPVEPDWRGRVPLPIEAIDRPGASYGMAVWPDETSEADAAALSTLRTTAFFPIPQEEPSGGWSDFARRSLDVVAERDSTEQEPGPQHPTFALQQVLDTWLGRRGQGRNSN